MAGWELRESWLGTEKSWLGTERERWNYVFKIDFL
jgi:hypothetical protein